MRNGQMLTPEEIQHYQMQMILQQQYAMKNAGAVFENQPGFNPVRVRKGAAVPAKGFYPQQEKEESSQNEYGEDDEEESDDNGLTEAEQFALNKKKFAEQLKQDLMANKKPAKAKKTEEPVTEERTSVVLLASKEDDSESK